MLSDDLLRAQLPHTLRQLDLPALGELYRGKVRDNYSRGDQIVMVTTDRISAFDHVLGTIPFKGEVLSRLTAFWFDKVKDIAPIHLVSAPDPSVMVVKRAKALPVEVITMAVAQVVRRFAAIGGEAVLRRGTITDNGHPILDVRGLEITDPLALETEINQVWSKH